MIKTIELYNGQFYIPNDGEKVLYGGEVLIGDNVHSCQQLYSLFERGIILKGDVVRVEHPVFDYVTGDGEHTKEELIKMREEKLKSYLYNLFIATMYETHGDSFED